MIIPLSAMEAAQKLLRQLESIRTPTEPQARFTGSLRKAMGYQSRNDLTKRNR